MSLCKDEDSPGSIDSPPDSDMDISSENSEPSAQMPQRGRSQAVQTRQGRGRGRRVRGRGRSRACARPGSSRQQSPVGRDVVSPANAATGKVNSKKTFCTATNVTKIYRVVQCGFSCHCRPVLSACWA